MGLRARARLQVARDLVRVRVRARVGVRARARLQVARDLVGPRVGRGHDADVDLEHLPH